MSTTSAADARAPQRQRGHVRVAAILAAGAALFREKGYDATTMTEIAARSGTAFGSLYRFFPSKEALANALLKQYAQQALDGLAALADRVPGMAPADMADGLIDFALSLQAGRSFVIAVMEGGKADKRTQFRQAVRDGVGLILQRLWPAMPEVQRVAMVAVVVHVLKGVAAAGQDGPDQHGMLVAEYRHLLRRYLAGT